MLSVPHKHTQKKKKKKKKERKKKKNIRLNNCNFMTKELRKTIMNRSKPKNKFFKIKNEETIRCFNHQSLLVSQNQKTLFWKTRL